MAKKSIIETHARSRIHRTEKSGFSWQVMKGLLWFLVFGILISCVWYVSRLPFFTLAEIHVEGGETISLEVIREKIDTELLGTYFLLIPKRFSYLYPHDRIVEVINSHDRIYNTEVERITRTSLSVRFDEYIPHALWCAAHDAVRCYFMTETGYAFAEAPQLDGGTFVRHVKEDIDDLHGGEVFEKERIMNLDMFTLRLNNELGLRISTILHKENGDATLFVNGGGALYITLSGDFDATFDHLSAILASDEFKHIEPGNFQYIDVRFDKKAYVNEESLTEPYSTTTATSIATSTLPEF